MASKGVLQIDTAGLVGTLGVLRNNSEASITPFRALINIPGVVGAVVPDAATEIVIERHEFYDWIWDGASSPQWFKLVFKPAATGFIFTLQSNLYTFDRIRHDSPNYTIIGNETIWLNRPITVLPPNNQTFLDGYGNVYGGSFKINTGATATSVARRFHFDAQVDVSDNLVAMDGWIDFEDHRFVKTF